MSLPQNDDEKYLSDIMSIAEYFGWHFSLWNWNNTIEFNYRNFDQIYGTHYMDSILIYLNRTETSVKNSDFPNSGITNFLLNQNFPNPYNPNTAIKYQIPELSFAALKVYDVLGNEIKILVNEEKPVGTYEIEFNASGLPSGVYLYRFQAGDFIETKKMVLLR